MKLDGKKIYDRDQIESALRLYGAFYSALYDGLIPQYEHCWESAEIHFKRNDNFHDFWVSLVEDRNDAFTSDREVSALLLTFNALSKNPLPIL